jgi:RNA polymerase sigma-70 factor (ECF subfamily)
MTIRPGQDLDALLVRVADGDRSAFSEVFEAVGPPISKLCRKLLKSESDAADATQEALEKVFTRAHQYDERRPALPWALAIAAWECRTIQRKRSRRREVSDDAAPELTAAGGEDELARRELVRVAVEAMGELSDEDREALVATFLEESASVSGATLRKRRERALSRVKRTLKRIYGFD